MSDAPRIPGWNHVYSGKVRDLYRPADGSAKMLVVASDRVSAFDHVLEPGIPGKGALLTSLSTWWFGQLAGADGGDPIANHLTGEGPPALVADRAMVVRSLDMLPIECVVRGYITGSGWAEYQESGTVCGIPLPEGLSNGDRLPEPIYTPAYKAPLGEHDENISFEKTVELVGADRAAELRDASLAIYSRAARAAEAKGLILADTKFEFGVDEDGVLRIADEVLTSDSSRYWDRAAWENGSAPAERMASFDKQIVRDWLAANWDKQGTPPRLPADVIARTVARYEQLLTRMTA
ncbi:phosphoribosylaminoimidazolesuccinocarboxamide synthase [Microbacterium suaedae]|uniref:phosphoribosylaminoimidazolesuccinocarboxamide synthase n=1 Tax=Microbacterium suaedae TaxID=2067813 RepID=UPI000DA15410|nr:phosphoribosylaminoimidazolesuccinocarboxamide synthase [Microbacterium suaedae]